MTILTSSKWIFVVSIIILRISSSLKRVVISPFTFCSLAFFFCALLFFTLYLLLVLNYSYTKERLLKDHCQSYKCFKITLTFSSFVIRRNIRLADTPVSIQIGVCQLTNVIFIEGVGNSIINILPIRRRFLLNIAGANRVDILIDYRTTSIDQFNGISKIIAIIGGRLISFKKVTTLYINKVESLKKRQKSPSDYRINFLTKKVNDIRLRIYICPLIDSIV